MKITIFKDLYKTNDVPYHVDVEKAIQRIKEGKSKDKVDAIRAGDKTLKNKLPCILFNGVFSERNSNSLMAHSGLMVCDFDKYPDTETMQLHYLELRKNKHFFIIFKSPSGNGYKCVIKVSNQLTKETHPKVFTQFQEDFKFEFWDKSNSNVDRVCYESYDPEIYVNYDAVEYLPTLKEKGFKLHEKPQLLPITNEDTIIEMIMAWGWKRDFVEGERNAFIFDLAGTFCEYGISESTAQGYIFNNVVIGDFSENETNTTIKSAYRKRQFDSKFFEDYKKIERVKSDIKNGKTDVKKVHNITDEVFNELKENIEHEDFWTIEKTKQGAEKIQIDLLKFKYFLERNGFKKHFPNGCQRPTWLCINSNKVAETSNEKIKDFVLDYLMKKGNTAVWKHCANYTALFSENILTMLDTIELMFLSDTKTTSYFAFNNGILEVTKTDIKLKDYIDIEGYIWENQIVKRDWIKQTKNDNDFKIFINKISNNEPLPTECVIGYLLSTFKNKTNNKAIILNDEVISENPEGGTGKGLFVQGIRQLRNVSILDGKSFDDKKSFPYQTVNQETNVLVFDDVVKNFSFENKFSLVTEGMTLERKNKDAIKLKVEESPKIIISTNYAIKGEGNSHDRRRFELEIAQYYGAEKTPFDEFKRQLFDDWNAEDFTRFDNYMIGCLQLFLAHGLIVQNAKNIKLRKFIAESCMEFNDWANDAENLPLNLRNNKKEYFTKFVEDYSDFKKFLTAKKFNSWLQKYAHYKGYVYSEGNSNGNRWFEILEF